MGSIVWSCSSSARAALINCFDIFSSRDPPLRYFQVLSPFGDFHFGLEHIVTLATTLHLPTSHSTYRPPPFGCRAIWSCSMWSDERWHLCQLLAKNVKNNFLKILVTSGQAEQHHLNYFWLHPILLISWTYTHPRGRSHKWPSEFRSSSSAENNESPLQGIWYHQYI